MFLWIYSNYRANITADNMYVGGSDEYNETVTNSLFYLGYNSDQTLTVKDSIFYALQFGPDYIYL